MSGDARTRAIDPDARRRAVRFVLDTYNKPTDAAVLATEHAVDALLAAGWRQPADDAASPLDRLATWAADHGYVLGVEHDPRDGGTPWYAGLWPVGHDAGNDGPEYAARGADAQEAARAALAAAEEGEA